MPTWLKYGCFGCLGVVGLIVLVGLTFVGLGYMGAQNEQIEEVTAQPVMPEIELPAEEPVEDAALPDATEAAATTLEAVRGTPPEIVRGTVHLNFNNVEGRVRPAEPGEPMRIEARFDKNAYELVENLQKADDGTWRYDVSFRRSRNSIITALKEAFSNHYPRMTLYLPRDVAIDVEAEVLEGGAIVELAGLTIRDARFVVKRGALQLSVREPLAAPMNRLDLGLRMGGLESSTLGNASPATLTSSNRMGGLELDLRGRWVQDGDVDVTVSMGGGAVLLPRGVNLTGARDRTIRPPEDTPAEVWIPTVSLSATANSGEIEFVE